MQYARFSTAGSIKDANGNDIGAFVNPRLNVFAELELRHRGPVAAGQRLRHG